MKTESTMNNMRGFTLVELMIVVLLSAIAVVAIYRGYTAFSQSADAQEQMIEMQQNLRIGMYMIEKDIRRAGMEEEDDENAGFWGFWLDGDETIDAANPHDPPVLPDPPDRLNPDPLYESSYISFTMDLGGTNPTTPDETWIPDDPGDGGLNDDDEWLTYKLVAAPLPSPVPDPPWTNFFNLVKTDENNGDPDDPDDMTIITNVDALNFVYLDEAGLDNIDPDTTPDDPATGRTFLTADEMASIRAVQITMVVRTTNEDYRYTNNEEYRNAQGSLIYTAPGDNFRRRMFSKEIKIRNAGL